MATRMAKPTRRIRNAEDYREHLNDIKMGITPAGGGDDTRAEKAAYERFLASKEKPAVRPKPSVGGAGSVAVVVGDTLGRAAAAPVNAVTGGQGGTVLLIMGVLLVAYLYVSRRLPNVIKAVSLPPDQLGQVTGSRISGPDPAQPPLEGIRRSSNPRYPVGTVPRDTIGDRIRAAEQRQGPADTRYHDPSTWTWETPDGKPSSAPRKGGYYVR